MTSGERWAYLGPEGTFTEQAALGLAERSTGPVELVATASVAAALDAVRAGEVGAACVPLESSVEGAVAVTQDELTHGAPLIIVAEAFVPITFDLLARPGTALSSVRSVGAHPHGHAQVRDWLARQLPAAEAVTAASNAAAAQAVADGSLDAAAAAPAAGARYGLVSLASDIGLVGDAVTRFLLLRRPGALPAPTGNDRTSLVLSVENRPGALLEVLTEFATRGINLTRLESRPTRAKLGEYVFLVDADGHLAQPAVADVVAALHRRSSLRRLLGSYPRADGVVGTVAEFATEAGYTRAAHQVGRWQAGEF